MAFWSTEKFEEELARSRDLPLVDPSDKKRIKHGAYELGVARRYAISRDESSDSYADEGTYIEIPAGHFAILMTDETVYVPPDAIAFISIKARYKLQGLVNVSGFHVDPGFHGRLKFSVYNANGKILHLDPKDPLFLIWYADLDRKTDDVYDGTHRNQSAITADDLRRIQGIVPSPAGGDKKIDGIKEEMQQKQDAHERELHSLKVYNKVYAWLIGILFTLLIATIGWLIKISSGE
jgi:dCTP deaminase